MILANIFILNKTKINNRVYNKSSTKLYIMNKLSQHILSNSTTLPPNTSYKMTSTNKQFTNTKSTIHPPTDGMLGMHEPVNSELKTKDQLIEKIKEWVKIDNDIRVLQKEQKKRLADKKKVSGELMAVMRTNGIDAFDLNDGQILYDKRNHKKPITKTALLSILTSYYNGDAVKASETNQYILDNREEVVREKIVRKITKPTNGEQ